MIGLPTLNMNKRHDLNFKHNPHVSVNGNSSSKTDATKNYNFHERPWKSKPFIKKNLSELSILSMQMPTDVFIYSRTILILYRTNLI